MSIPAHPELIFGGAVVGLDIPDSAILSAIFKTLRSGGVAAIDTAGRYPPKYPGRSEELLGETDAAGYGFIIDTKVLALPTTDGSGDLEPAAARASLAQSLNRMQLTKVRTLYIHRPDPQTPLVNQARGLDALYREGKIQSIGLSNFSSEEIEGFVKVCEENGLVKPSVYQGCYNVIERELEEKLLPVLRKHGIRFVAYRAVAAGFLAGNSSAGGGQAGGKEGTRFAADHPFAAAMKQFYGSENAKKAYDLLHSALSEEDCTVRNPIEAAIRWICYHSALNEKDAVLLGASKESQIVQNLEAIKKGPLPERVAAKLSQISSVLHQSGIDFGR